MGSQTFTKYSPSYLLKLNISFQSATENLTAAVLKNEEAYKRNQKIRVFQKKADIKDHSEARYYLEQSNYDLEKAAEKYKEDLHWEEQNPGQPPTKELLERIQRGQIFMKRSGSISSTTSSSSSSPSQISTESCGFSSFFYQLSIFIKPI